jgi:hypothetical protein
MIMDNFRIESEAEPLSFHTFKRVEIDSNTRYLFLNRTKNKSEFRVTFYLKEVINDSSVCSLKHSYVFKAINLKKMSYDSPELLEFIKELVLRSVKQCNDSYSYLFNIEGDGSWILKALRDGDRRVDDLYNRVDHEHSYLGKVRHGLADFLTIMVGSGFKLFFGIAIFFELSNFDKDTTSLTNYGFAFLVGISSLAFSWSRNILTENKERANRILDNAVQGFYCAIIFLLGSALKHIAFAKDIFFFSMLFNAIPWILWIPKIWAFLCFFIATYFSTKVIEELLKIVSYHKLTRQREIQYWERWE